MEEKVNGGLGVRKGGQEYVFIYIYIFALFLICDFWRHRGTVNLNNNSFRWETCRVSSGVVVVVFVTTSASRGRSGPGLDHKLTFCRFESNTGKTVFGGEKINSQKSNSEDNF